MRLGARVERRAALLMVGREEVDILRPLFGLLRRDVR